MDASKKATYVPVHAVVMATARQMKTMVNEFYMLCVRMFLLMNTCYTKHHSYTVNRCTNYTLRLIFAPRCYGEYFSSRKEKGCDHLVIIVALDNVWDYVCVSFKMVSPWLLQYQIRQGILHSTTFCHGFIQSRGMAKHYMQG